MLPWTIFLQEKWCADMGGRGTFAAVKNVSYLYEIDKHFDFAPDGIIDGIKIIKGIDFGDNNPKHDLPASSHLSNSYINTILMVHSIRCDYMIRITPCDLK